MNILKVLAAACLMLIATMTVWSTTALARGGAANLMGSPGYQRALKESRDNYRRSYYGQPYTQPPAVYPGRKWRHRAWRHHRR